MRCRSIDGRAGGVILEGMTLARRQQRLRVLEALERRIKQFRTREELYPLRVPREPLPLDEVIEEALGDDGVRFDPVALRSRTLLHLTWADGSTWEVWVAALPSGMKLFCDSGGGDSHVLATGGRNAGDETDRLFLARLAASAGEDFGIEMAGGAPSRVRSSVMDREFLVDVFLELFETTGVQDSVRADNRLARSERPTASVAQRAPDIGTRPHDFRTDVERWLGDALR